MEAPYNNLTPWQAKMQQGPATLVIVVKPTKRRLHAWQQRKTCTHTLLTPTSLFYVTSDRHVQYPFQSSTQYSKENSFVVLEQRLDVQGSISTSFWRGAWALSTHFWLPRENFRNHPSLGATVFALGWVNAFQSGTLAGSKGQTKHIPRTCLGHVLANLCSSYFANRKSCWPLLGLWLEQTVAEPHCQGSAILAWPHS